MLRRPRKGNAFGFSELFSHGKTNSSKNVAVTNSFIFGRVRNWAKI